MSSPLQGGARRRRSASRLMPLLVVVLAAGAIAAAVALLSGGGSNGGGDARAGNAAKSAKHSSKRRAHREGAQGNLAPMPPPGISISGPNAVAVHLNPKPGAALLFDVDTGRVLWRLHPMRVRPIASVTKIMTALLVTQRLPYDAKATISHAALHYTGSEVGVLPHAKRVPIQTLLYGLLLPSGNDAAVALAE